MFFLEFFEKGQLQLGLLVDLEKPHETIRTRTQQFLYRDIGTSSRICNSHMVCSSYEPFNQFPVHSNCAFSSLHDLISPSMPPLKRTCSVLLCGLTPPANENRGPVCFLSVCFGSGTSSFKAEERLHILIRQSSEEVAKRGSELLYNGIIAVTTSKCAPNFFLSFNRRCPPMFLIDSSLISSVILKGASSRNLRSLVMLNTSTLTLSKTLHGCSSLAVLQS